MLLISGVSYLISIQAASVGGLFHCQLDRALHVSMCDLSHFRFDPDPAL
jgi:hypothetical protein